MAERTPVTRNGSGAFNAAAAAAAAPATTTNEDTAPTTTGRPSCSHSHCHCTVRREYKYEYYEGELDRLVQEILQQKQKPQDKGYRRIALLQFPDELLTDDAPQLCWEFEFERQLSLEADTVTANTGTAPCCCCPDLDLVAATQQAEADVLHVVHCGHACWCLSSANRSNGNGSCRDDVDVAAACVPEMVERLLLLLYEYEVSYHHCVAELQAALLSSSTPALQEVAVGSLPSWAHILSTTAVPSSSTAGDCCRRSETNCGSSSSVTPNPDGCHRPILQSDSTSTTSTATSNQATSNSSTGETGVVQDQNPAEPPPLLQPHQITVGGLELPAQVVAHGGYTALFLLGRDTSRPFFNTVLRFLSSNHHRPDQFWTWSPETGLSSSSSWLSSPSFQRTLNRHFYLVQKVRQCCVFGILVAHMTHDTRRLVASLHHESATSYTLVVGKINPAKLTNFPEIDCFVLVACPEQSLLSDHAGYTTHPADDWRAMGEIYAVTAKSENDNDDDDDDDDDVSDAPCFSLVTGKYEASQTAASPGDDDAALTAYCSAATDFLRQREYQGLTVVVADDDDDDKVHAAVPGRTGIASKLLLVVIVGLAFLAPTAAAATAPTPTHDDGDHVKVSPTASSVHGLLASSSASVAAAALSFGEILGKRRRVVAVILILILIGAWLKRKEHKAAVLLQKVWRRAVAQERWLKQRAAALLLQKVWRRAVAQEPLAQTARSSIAPPESVAQGCRSKPLAQTARSSIAPPESVAQGCRSKPLAQTASSSIAAPESVARPKTSPGSQQQTPKELQEAPANVALCS